MIMTTTTTGRLRFVKRYIDNNVIAPTHPLANYVWSDITNKVEVKILQQEYRDVDTEKLFWQDVTIESESV